MSYGWLRAMETYWRFYRPRYLFLEDEQGPCAAAVADSYASLKNSGGAGWLRQRLSLAVRPPFSSMCGVMVRPGLALEAVMPHLGPGLSRFCRRQGRLLLTVSNVEAAHLPAWQQAGFVAVPQPAISLIDLPASYDEYLESLPRKDRQELRRIGKRIPEFDIRFEIGPSAEDGEQFYPLFCEVFASHGVSPQAMPFTPQFFPALAKEIPGGVLFLRSYVGNQLAGAIVCLVSDSTLWLPMIGMHYEIARPAYLYFLLQDEAIRWGIQHGIRRIYGGKTNEHEKKGHGYRQEERWLCYRASVGPLNRVSALAFPVAQRLLQR